MKETIRQVDKNTDCVWECAREKANVNTYILPKKMTVCRIIQVMKIERKIVHGYSEDQIVCT
jgi:hypothetical protein